MKKHWKCLPKSRHEAEESLQDIHPTCAGFSASLKRLLPSGPGAAGCDPLPPERLNWADAPSAKLSRLGRDSLAFTEQ
jgi:hypothetical protein